MNDLYQCGTCGQTEPIPETTAKSGEGAACLACGGPFSGFTRIPYNSGYDKPHLLNLWVRASSLELVAGREKPERGMIEALGRAMASPRSAEALRDAAAFIETQLNVLDVKALSGQIGARLASSAIPTATAVSVLIDHARTLLGQGDPSDLEDSAAQEKFAGAGDRLLAAALNQCWMNGEADDDVRTLDGRAVQIGPFILYVGDGERLTAEAYHSADAASLIICNLVEEFERGGP